MLIVINITGTALKPYINTVKGIQGLLRWQSSSYTLIVFMVGSCYQLFWIHVNFKKPFAHIDISLSCYFRSNDYWYNLKKLHIYTTFLQILWHMWKKPLDIYIFYIIFWLDISTDKLDISTDNSIKKYSLLP